MTVRVESQPLTPRELPVLFYSVSDSGFHDFESELDDDRTVNEWEVILEFTDCRIYKVQHREKAKFTTPKLSELGVRILAIESVERGWYLKLQAPDKESLGAYWQYCRDDNVQFNLQKLYSSGPQATAVDSGNIRSQLTSRQREVARTVTLMGYYDTEGASATEVADELDISPSTLSTHLRRITAKVFDELFGDA